MDDILRLIGGLLQAGSSIYTATQSNQQAQTAEQQRNQQYTQLNNLVNNPGELLSRIMAMKRSLTEDEKNLIIQTVTSRMVASGQGGMPGLINAAVDQALTQADSALFQEAAQSYLATLGLPIQALRNQVPASLYPTSGAAAGSFSGPANSLGALAKAIQKATNPQQTGLNYTGPGWSDPNSAMQPFGVDVAGGYSGAESAVPVPSDMTAASSLVDVPLMAGI